MVVSWCKGPDACYAGGIRERRRTAFNASTMVSGALSFSRVMNSWELSREDATRSTLSPVPFARFDGCT